MRPQKLSEELIQYLQDPRFKQVLDLVAPSRPDANSASISDEPQKVNNLMFIEKGWLQYDNRLRGLLEHKPNTTITETPVDYGVEEDE